MYMVEMRVNHSLVVGLMDFPFNPLIASHLQSAN